MRIVRILPLAALAAGLAATPVLAADDAVSIAVSRSGLNLANRGDVARLQSRIGRAATSACAEPGARGTAAYSAYTACRQDALGRATATMDRAIAAASMPGAGAVRVARR